MSYLKLLILSTLVSYVGHDTIKNYAWIWYLAALVLDIGYLYTLMVPVSPVFLRAFSSLIQRGLLATAIFTVVMYVSVFPQASKFRQRISPIRGELSIIACILAIGHIAKYTNSYCYVIVNNFTAISVNHSVSLMIAFVLSVLLLLLGITSIKEVRHRMNFVTWRKLQKTAYIFFGLIYLHEFFVLYPSALKSAGEARLTLIISGIIFVGYFILRLNRYRLDLKMKSI